MTITADIQKLEPGAIVELFELDATALGYTVLRFYAGTNGLRQPLVWQGNTYEPYALEAQGFEMSSKGQAPRPKLKVGNIAGAITALCLAYSDLVGAKLTRKRTLVKYLDDANYPASQKPASLLTVTRAGTNATYFDSTGTLRTAAANTPRLNYDPTNLAAGSKLLVEESRANRIRNNTMVGATAGTIGSGGVLPTNWQKDSTAAQSTIVVGTGAENGISYIDVRFTATTNDRAYLALYPEPTNGSGITGLTAGKSIAGSQYVKLISGSIPNNGLSANLRHLTSAGVMISDASAVVTPGASSANLAACRSSVISSSTPTNTERMTMFWLVQNLTIGAAFDFTLRIGLPQFEEGLTVTSPILTSGSAVTRPTDVPAISGANFSSWYRQDEGTFLVTGNGYKTKMLLVADDGAANNRIQLAVGSNAAFEAYTLVGGSATNSFSGASLPPAELTTGTIAFAIKSGSSNAAINGTLPFGADKTGSIPTGLTTLRFGALSTGGGILNGGIARVAYYRRRLTNAELQTLSSGGSLSTPPDMEMIFTAGSVQTYLLQPYNPSADPDSHLADDVFYVDRKASETKSAVEFELAPAFDLTNVQLPRRQIIQNVCVWAYRGSECGYTGTAYYNANDELVATLADDVCGKRLSSCKKRFGQYAELPFGSFPAAGLVRT